MDHKLSQEELSTLLAKAGKLVTVNALYKHYKGPLYKVIGLAIIEETNEPAVIYQAQYGERITYIRPLKVWIEEVEVNGAQVSRFTKL